MKEMCELCMNCGIQSKYGEGTPMCVQLLAASRKSKTIYFFTTSCISTSYIKPDEVLLMPSYGDKRHSLFPFSNTYKIREGRHEKLAYGIFSDCCVTGHCNTIAQFLESITRFVSLSPSICFCK